jgi:hypothetical protein
MSLIGGEFSPPFCTFLLFLVCLEVLTFRGGIFNAPFCTFLLFIVCLKNPREVELARSADCSHLGRSKMASNLICVDETADAADLIEFLRIRSLPATELPTPTETRTPSSKPSGPIRWKKKLGEGVFGIVTHVFNVTTGAEYALKEPKNKFPGIHFEGLENGS